MAPARQAMRGRELPRWLAVLYRIEQTAAIGVLIVLGPVLAILAAAIWAVSRRTPFVAHLRVGQEGRPLRVFKYRTMWGGRAGSRIPALRLVEDVTDKTCPVKHENDPRVTSRFAQILRRHSIDELPQLLHIARGEMSLVGPRPITAAELEAHYGSHAEEVLTARPGLTGLWQTMGRNRLTYRQRLRLDLFLVRRCCFRLYLRVLWRTIPRVFSGKDAW